MRHANVAAIALGLACIHQALAQLVNTDWSTPLSVDTIPGDLYGTGFTLVAACSSRGVGGDLIRLTV